MMVLTMHYFSYGHNTDLPEMRSRVPGAKLLGGATLPGYRMVLRKYANIVPDPHEIVQGVLYEIPVTSLAELDGDESYGLHYRHEMVRVLHNGRLLPAMTYVMLPSYKEDSLPSERYIRWIAQGYLNNQIPLEQLTHALRERLSLV